MLVHCLSRYWYGAGTELVHYLSQYWYGAGAELVLTWDS